MIPSRRLVLLYLATAHASLALAFALVGLDPLGVAGFLYHSRMVAIVHLVTIGWIAMSILGNVYVVLPMAFGRPLPARRGDYTAYALIVIGLTGMFAHFWLAEFSGMAWSAATAAAGIAHVAVRVVVNVRGARVPGGVKMHLYLASANILLAVTAGVLLGFDKVYHFLPGYVLANVFAHAHLAAVGWVCMTVIGFAYRLLPMLIPAAPPMGPRLYVGAILLEIGVVGLFASLVLQSAFSPLFALFIVAAFVTAGVNVCWMLKHRRNPPPGRHERGFALAHVATASIWLIFACVAGVGLTIAPVTETTLRVALVYGVFGLVGFLAQVIVGFELYVLPMAAAYWAVQKSENAIVAPSPPGEIRRSAVYLAWLTGVPAIGAGLFFNAPIVLAAGAWLLFGAVLVAAFDLMMVVGRSRVKF